MDDADGAWLRAGHDGSSWFRDLEARPDVEVERGGETLAVRAARTEAGNTPYSVAILRRETPISICFTPLGQCEGQVPQVVQRQMSSPSISVRPRLASRMILRMLKFLTLFQGQTTSHLPHW